MTERYLVDTNILIYGFTQIDVKKQKIAKDLIMRSQGQYISIQNIVEFVNVVYNKFSQKPDKAQMKSLIESFGDYFVVLSYNANTVSFALDICDKYGIHFFDALLVATMLEHNIYKIYTENVSDFKKVDKIEAVNPF